MGLNPSNLKEFYINTFGNINLDFSNIEDIDKQKLIKLFKIPKDLDKFGINDFNNYITLDYQCKKIYTYLKNKFH